MRHFTSYPPTLDRDYSCVHITVKCGIYVTSLILVQATFISGNKLDIYQIIFAMQLQCKPMKYKAMETDCRDI